MQNDEESELANSVFAVAANVGGAGGVFRCAAGDHARDQFRAARAVRRPRAGGASLEVFVVRRIFSGLWGGGGGAWADLVAVAVAGGGDDFVMPRRQLSRRILRGAGGAAGAEEPAAGAGGGAVLDELFDPHLRVGADPAERRVAQYALDAAAPGRSAFGAAAELFCDPGRAGGWRIALHDPAVVCVAREAGSHAAGGVG